MIKPSKDIQLRSLASSIDATMRTISILLLIVEFLCMMSCEWIQISHSPRFSYKNIPLNTSLLLKDTEILFLDRYTDFKDNDRSQSNELFFNTDNFSYQYPVNYSNVSIFNRTKDNFKMNSYRFDEIQDRNNKLTNTMDETMLSSTSDKKIDYGQSILQSNSFENLLAFFINLQQSFSNKEIQYKTKFLENIKNGILFEIGVFRKERI